MKDKAPCSGRDGVARCPICGHKATFGLLVARLRLLHYKQVAAGHWRRLRGYPAKFDTHSTITLICAGCAYPLGQPPQAILAEAGERPRRAH